MMDFLLNKTYLFFFTQSFWRDEAFTVILSRKPILDLIVNTAKDFNPPFYYLLIHFWMKIFGSSEISIRSVSLIFYWLTIYMCYLFLINILKFNVKKSFLYLIFFILNPFLIAYACEARMYTMFAFLSTASFYFFLTKRKKPYIIFTSLGIFTHYFMVFPILIQIIFTVVKKQKKQMVNCLYPIIFFLPWAIFVFLQKNWGSTSFWIEKTIWKTLVNLPAYLFTGYEDTYKFMKETVTKAAYSFWIFIIGGFFLIKTKKRRIDDYFYIVLAWGLIIPFLLAIISFYKPVFLLRYLIFSSVGFLLMLIYIWDKLHLLIRLAILGMVIFFALNFQKIDIKEHKKSDYRKIMSEIKYLAKPGDLMYVTSELDYFTAQYYFDENRVYIYGKKYEEIPDYVGKILIPQSRIIYTLPKYPNKAFILTSDSQYEIQSSL